MAEAHPVGFQWVMEAKRRGAKIIHVDPRFTRTSRGGRPARPVPGRRRHRLPRRPDQLRAARTTSTSASTSRRSRTRPTSSARTSSTPRTWPGSSPATTPRPAGTTRSAGSSRASPTRRRRPGSVTTGSPSSASTHAAMASDTGGGAGDAANATGAPAARRDAAAPPLRLPGPQAALRALHPRGGRRRSAAWPRRVPRGRPRDHRELGPRPHDGVGLLGGLDPPQRRRAVHPRRGDPADAARQHGAPRRRHPRAARPRVDPGLDRHPDALRPAAGLHPHAQRAPAPDLRVVPRRGRGQDRVLGTHGRLHGEPAQGLVGRRGDRRQRLRRSTTCRA